MRRVQSRPATTAFLLVRCRWYCGHVQRVRCPSMRHRGVLATFVPHPPLPRSDAPVVVDVGTPCTCVDAMPDGTSALVGDETGACCALDETTA